LLAAVLALASPPARADDDRRAEADRQFYLGKYQQALDLYQTLANETGNPGYLCNVGRCQARLGKPELAIQNMRACLARATLDRAKRREYEGRVREMEREMQQGEQRERENRPPSAGDTPAPAPPPAGTDAAGPPPSTAPFAGVAQAAGPSAPVLSDSPPTTAYQYPNPLAEPPRPLIPAAPPRSRSAWPYVMSALAAVGLAVGVGFGIQAKDRADQLGHRYDPALEDQMHTANGLQTIGYLTAITGVVLAYVTSGGEKGGR
jgi:hypothetical protein